MYDLLILKKVKKKSNLYFILKLTQKFNKNKKKKAKHMFIFYLTILTIFQYF